MRTIGLDCLYIILLDLLCKKLHLVGEPSNCRYDCNARGVEVVRHAAILVGKRPTQYDFVGEGSSDLWYEPTNQNIENDVFQAVGDFETRDDRKQSQGHFKRVAQVVFLADKFQLCDKIRIGVGCRSKHGETPFVSKSAVLYNFSSSRCGEFTAVVRAGSVRKHLVGSFRLLNKDQLRGFRFLLHNLLHFIMRFGRFLQIELKRSQHLSVQRAAIIFRALCQRVVDVFFIFREANSYSRVHSGNISPLLRHVNPQFFGVI